MITYSELRQAKVAYDRGELPISRWTKAVFVLAVQEALGFVPDWVKALPKVRMYDYLVETGVYVTGNRRKYRNTTFYGLDVSKILKHCA